MRRILCCMIACCLMLCLGSTAIGEKAGNPANNGAAASIPEEAQKEWNVLVYLCGTDLETEDKLATENLKAIAETVPNGSVNFIIETGGTKQWHAEELGMQISSDALQRWVYGEDGFVLVDEVPEASMARGDTLSDFIRWAGENYQAKKNMLLLWDHGGGSCYGMFLDENYSEEGKSPSIMMIHTLEKALENGGMHFDLLLADMCLMATLEMCQAVQGYADYMATSEETMAGAGTNYKSWVQYLFDRPGCTPVQLGKRICDSTQQYYTQKDETRTIASFTMSLIDLSKTDKVAAALNAFLHEVSGLLQSPQEFYRYADATRYAENYSLDAMYDIFDLSQKAEQAGISKEVTHALQDAVEEAVLYNLRSSSHMFSHGLSFYYLPGEDSKMLDRFALTCKNPEQLAYFDATHWNWEAPAWVYETIEKHPELNRRDYAVKPAVSVSEDGTKCSMTLETGIGAADFLFYEVMYRGDKGELFTLGKSGNVQEYQEENGEYRFELGFDGTWPTLFGKPQYMDIADETMDYILYNVPVKWDDSKMWMRVLVKYEAPDKETGSTGETKIYHETDGLPMEIQGIWDGLDSHTGLPGRNVMPLYEVYGEKLKMYDVAYSSMLNKVSDYLDNGEFEMTADSKMEREKLPEGTYQVRFVVRDVFGSMHCSDFVDAVWDGKQVRFQKQ